MKPLNKLGIFFLVFISITGCDSQNKPEDTDEDFQILLDHKPNEKRVDVSIDGALFTSFLYADTLTKPILFPIIDVRGITITRGYPLVPVPGDHVDHPHHTGFWFTYGDVNIIDYWGTTRAIPAERKNLYGTIQLKSIDLIQYSNNKGTLKVTQDWIDPEGTTVLEEKVEYRFYAYPDKRMIDRNTTLIAKVPEVVFEDNKEGAFAIRVARFLELPSNEPITYVEANGKPSEVPVIDNSQSRGNYLSSEGLEGDSVWATRARWMKLYSTKNGIHISITIMDHPDNPGHPTYWHARGYGLFSANPFGQKVFSNGKEELNLAIKNGDSVTFRHRMLIRSGAEDISNQEIESEYNQFIQ
jgi:hypothetical protein